MSLLLMWKQQLLMNNFKYFSLTGSGSLLLPGSIKGKFKELTLIGNSMQGENPSPDNPQEIKNAGRKSKNLFNIADLRVGQVQKDGTINEKSTSYRTVILDVPQDGKYRITFNSNDDYTMLYFTEAYANGAYSKPYIRVQAGNPNHYITLEKGKNILSFSTHTASGNIAFTTDHNIMIAAESETLGYEPYGYLLDVKVTGKNLLDMADIQSGNGKIESSYTTAKSVKSFRVIKDRKYLLISKGTMIVDTVYSSIHFGKDDLEYMKNHADILSVGLGYKIFIGEETRTILTAKETCTITKVLIHGTKNAADAYEAEELGLFEIINDNTNIDYQPYTEQSMQIVLNEPLRGVVEYKDVLTKDGVVRKIKRIVFDGSENWVIHKEKETTVSFWTNSFKFLFPTHNAMLVDKFAYVISGMNKEEVSWSVYGSNFYININKDIVSNLETFKTWLSQNPVTVEYIAIEPTTEHLPESVQAQLQAMHSENGTTHVFVDSGEVAAEISATYMRK